LKESDKMVSKVPGKKLSLNKETLRSLTGAELHGVAGGSLHQNPSVPCPVFSNAQCPLTGGSLTAEGTSVSMPVTVCGNGLTLHLPDLGPGLP
jgi:hypothetical protein